MTDCMTNSNEHKLLLVQQNYEESEKLKAIWCGEGIPAAQLTVDDAVSARMLVHKIAGGSVTFGVENVASIAKVCEKILTDISTGGKSSGEYLGLEDIERISQFIMHLYNACALAKDEYIQTKSSIEKKDVETADQINTNSPLVLVADDDIVMQGFLKQRLLKKGFDIVVADDGVQAVELALQHKPRLILMDGLMPNMNGFQALDAIRKNENIAHIPVFMLTGLSEQENVAEGMINGADDYILKPFDMEELFEKIDKKLNVKF